jgi:hypothetical protein
MQRISIQPTQWHKLMNPSFRNIIALQKYLGAMLDANHEIAVGHPNTGFGFNRYYRGDNCHEIRAHAIQRINRLLPKCIATLDRLKRELNLDSHARHEAAHTVEMQLFSLAGLMNGGPELHHDEARDIEHVLDMVLGRLRMIPPRPAAMGCQDPPEGPPATNPVSAAPSPGIPPYVLRAHQQYQRAREHANKNGKSLETDRDVFEYFLEHIREDEEPRCKKVKTWIRYIRRYRQITGTQVNQPAGAREGKSVVHAKDIERP